MAALLCKKSSLPLRFLNLMKKLQKQDDSSTRLFGFPPNIYSIRSSSAFSSRSSADEVKDMFEAWMIKHEKVYNTPAEKDKRLQIFRENLEVIEKHNSTGNSSHTKGLNKFSDLTLEEFRRGYLGGRM